MKREANMKTFIRGLCAGLVLACAAGGALAQAYPSKPIRLISGFAAGGPSDAIARSIAKALGDELKQPVVVENRGGVAGLLGLEAVTNAAPDGYTIGLLANTTTNALHAQNKKLDMASHFEPIGKFVSTRILLVANAQTVPAKNLPEFIDYLKKNPGTNLTSAGHGGLGHLGLELFALDQKLDIVHVSYRGSAPALQDVLSGQIAGMVIDASTAMPHIESGKLRAIAAVSTSRTPYLPKLATAKKPALADACRISVMACRISGT